MTNFPKSISVEAENGTWFLKEKYLDKVLSNIEHMKLVPQFSNKKGKTNIYYKL